MSEHDKWERLFNVLSIESSIPYNYYLPWHPPLLWLHIASDLLITLVYYSLSFLLIYLTRQRKDLPYPKLAIVFAILITVCGTAYLLSASTAWTPLYWLDGPLNAFTGIISMAVAVLVVWNIRHTLSLLNAAQLQAEIEQRATAEQALHAANSALSKHIARTQLLLDSALDGIVSIDHNGEVIGWNAQAEHIFGYSSEQALGRGMAELIVPPALREKHLRGLSRFIETGVSTIIGQRLEITGLRADMSEFPMELTVGVLKQQDNYFFNAYIRDITERKQVEDALRQSQKELQEAQRIAHMGSWQLELTSHRIVWSKGLYRILGLDPELPPPAYTDYSRLFSPESWERLSSALSHTQKTGDPYELELEIIKADGSHGWILARGEAIYDDKGIIVGRHGVALDITERKIMENELKTSEAKFRSIIEMSPVPMALHDEQQNITLLNPAFVQAFGYTLDDIPTVAEWRTKAFPDPSYRRWLETHWQTVQEKAKQERSGVPPLELTIRCSNNNTKTVLASAATIDHDCSGMCLVILYDITQHKQIEAQLKSIFNASVEGIITTDMNNIIVSANA
ncbi:MAG: PAS domain S-box protein, partial [Methylobacter sp.]